VGTSPQGWAARRSAFWGIALRLGGERFGRLIAVLGIFAGVSILGLVARALGLGWPWAILLVVLVILALFAEGAYRVWDHTEKVARYYYPSWEIIRNRADTMQSLVDASRIVNGALVAVEDVPEGSKASFRGQWVGSHRKAALKDYNRADLVGFAPRVSEQEIEGAELTDMPAIIEAFHEAASRWREAEAAA